MRAIDAVHAMVPNLCLSAANHCYPTKLSHNICCSDGDVAKEANVPTMDCWKMLQGAYLFLGWS